MLFEIGVVLLVDLLCEFYMQVSQGDTRDIMRRQILLHNSNITKRFSKMFERKTQ